MVQVKADGAVVAFLEPIKERAEVLDAQGTLIGYYEPASSEEDALYRHAMTLFDPEEVRRSLLDQSPGSTTAEVLERLRALENA